LTKCRLAVLLDDVKVGVVRTATSFANLTNDGVDATGEGVVEDGKSAL
jgi:hypothetical protein